VSPLEEGRLSEVQPRLWVAGWGELLWNVVFAFLFVVSVRRCFSELKSDVRQNVELDVYGTVTVLEANTSSIEIGLLVLTSSFTWDK
jgi:hypothetical protein